MHKQAETTEIHPQLSDLTEQSLVDRTVWNKKWPWVVTPNDDIAMQVAKHNNTCGSSYNPEIILHAQPLQVISGDSGSEDSTDSSGTYFV